MGRRTLCTVVIVAVVLSMLAATGATRAPEAGVAGIDTSADTDETDSVTEITGCRVIDEPGRYVLTEDVVNSTAKHCIRIVASDVVFDGQGHTLHARDADHKTEAVAAGYTEPAIENVTIENLVVSGWVQGVGCAMVGDGVTVRNVTARRNGLTAPPGPENGYGIYVGEYTNNVTVVDNVAVDNAQGIVIDETNDTVIRNNLVRGNARGGVFVGDETWRTRIVDNRIVSNRWSVVVRANDTTVRGNVMSGDEIDVRAHRNASDVAVVDNRMRGGVEIARANRATVHGNRIDGGQMGVRVRDGARDVTLAGNRIRNVSENGIVVRSGARDVSVTGNVVGNGGNHGIWLAGADETLLRNNTVRNVSSAGVLIDGAARGNALFSTRIVGANRGLLVRGDAGGTVVRGLVVSRSLEASVRLIGDGSHTVSDARIRGGEGVHVASSDNRFRNLTVTDTIEYGVQVDGARNVTMTDVTVSDAGQYPVEAGGDTRNLTVANLTLETARLSVTGGDLRVGPATVPRPPDGHDDLGVAVRLGVPSDDPVRLTLAYPDDPSVDGSVSLWRHDGSWARFDDATVDDGRSVASVTVDRTDELVVAPLVPSPTPTATRTETPASTATPGSSPTPDGSERAPASTAGPTAPTDGTSGDGPGFGVGATLVALLVLVGGLRNRR